MLLIQQKSEVEIELAVNSEEAENSSTFLPSLIPARMILMAPATSL